MEHSWPTSGRFRQPSLAQAAPEPGQTGARVDTANEQVARYAPLVKKIACGIQRRLPRHVLSEDLVAAGMGGLWDALRRRGQHTPGSFEWYVRVRVRGAILDELRAQDWLPRRARAKAANDIPGTKAPFLVVRFDDISEWEQHRCLATAQSATSEQEVSHKLASERVARAVQQLPERERHIISMHYYRGVRFKDLGSELGVSEPRVSQLHSRAMRRLRTLLNDAA
jgi:RNA polymerase sigma factor for flagellar operon FliA